MILCTRAVARDFRALLARCVSGRPRGPAPPVVVEVKGGRRTLASTTAEGVTLAHASQAPGEADDLVVLPGSVLAGAEGGTVEPVVLERQSKLAGVLRWSGEGPRALPAELILPGRQHELPAVPQLTAVSAELLAALHECGRCAAKEGSRLALSRVQIQGKAGRVIGTDGKAALIWKGFRFPFPDEVLLPALPVFGAKPLARAADVRVGRTATHLVVCAGPWSVWLPADTSAKYPDVAAVIPRQAPTTVVLDPADAEQLLAQLPGLPGNCHDLRPVTLDAGDGVRVSGQAEGGENVSETREVPLPRSSVTGPALRVALDRRVLARALSLGCLTLRLTTGKPVVAQGGEVTLVAAQLDPALIARPAGGPAGSSPAPADSPPTTPQERSDAVKPPEPGGRPPSPDEPPDPLAAAEELRAALADTLAKAGRLVAALKAARKQKKALASVWAGLRQLNLANGETR